MPILKEKVRPTTSPFESIDVDLEIAIFLCTKAKLSSSKHRLLPSRISGLPSERTFATFCLFFIPAFTFIGFDLLLDYFPAVHFKVFDLGRNRTELVASSFSPGVIESGE